MNTDLSLTNEETAVTLEIPEVNEVGDDEEETDETFTAYLPLLTVSEISNLLIEAGFDVSHPIGAWKARM